MQKVFGTLQSGHQVASGIAKNSPYPKGTIELQQPFFESLGLDLAPYFFGTLNINIAPHSFQLIQPQYTFRTVRWHPDYPPEDFSFSPCQVIFQEQAHKALVYYPHPETKIGHFQDPSVIEVIATTITSISYGNSLAIALNPQEIRIF